MNNYTTNNNNGKKKSPAPSPPGHPPVTTSNEDLAEAFDGQESVVKIAAGNVLCIFLRFISNVGITFLPSNSILVNKICSDFHPSL